MKPFIPRWFQIKLRRAVILRKRLKHSHVWPIDEEAGRTPKAWSGWPEGKRFALVLTHDVEGVKGVQKCVQLVRLEESRGFRSSFNFVAEDCEVSAELFNDLESRGFEIGVHGLHHDGNLFGSRKRFREQAIRINSYLKEWGSVGFRTPCMYHNLDWIHDLDIEYDSSTFDTDPFEPQPDGMGTIFPFWVPSNNSSNSTNPSNLEPLSFNLSPSSSNLQPPTVSHVGFIELPYTLPQDFTLFILMKEKNIDIWKKKLNWIVKEGGMALLVTHPDYVNGKRNRCGIEEYPMEFYEEFLDYVKGKYEGQYWNPLPKEIAHFWKQKIVIPESSKSME